MATDKPFGFLYIKVNAKAKEDMFYDTLQRRLIPRQEAESQSNKSSPVQTVTYGTVWKQVDGGRNHSAAIKNDGTCWVWGDNTNGRLGVGDIDNRSSPVQTIMADNKWLYVSAGYETTFGIRKA
jgi:alpha-tubulin suppressor-like RCC1 family protein